MRCIYESTCPEYQPYRMLCKWFSDECSIKKSNIDNELKYQRELLARREKILALAEGVTLEEAV
jgi:hypothetical protein